MRAVMRKELQGQQSQGALSIDTHRETAKKESDTITDVTEGLQSQQLRLWFSPGTAEKHRSYVFEAVVLSSLLKSVSL